MLKFLKVKKNNEIKYMIHYDFDEIYCLLITRNCYLDTFLNL